jgi:uncharacterized protein YbcI
MCPPAQRTDNFDPSRVDAIVTAISTEIPRIEHRHHGRAPKATRTIWHDDVLVCVLDGVFTEAEQGLVAAGEFERVRRKRLERRDGLEPTYRALVETLTGRPVRAYMTEVAPEDVAFEAFMLGPPPGRS